jgi:glycogen debranching enzyme
MQVKSDQSKHLKKELGITLFAGEEIIETVAHEIHRHQRYPVSSRILQKLANVNRHQDIGKNGPCLASGVSEENQHIKALRSYEAIFGRDSLISAFFVADQYPLLLGNTLIYLAKLQGVGYHTYREEEPGRIIHEFRDPVLDERAREYTDKFGWAWPYYGSVDATILFILGIYRYQMLNIKKGQFLKTEFAGRDKETKIIFDALTAAVGWLLGRMDKNPEGLIESKPAFPGSLEGQAWKDSWEAYHHSDKTIANHHYGIASIEVQGIAYDALLLAASLLDQVDRSKINDKLTGKSISSNILRERAAILKKAIFKHFWIDEKEGYFALGTDRDEKGKLRVMKIRTSNMGHLLNSRLLDGRKQDVIHYKKAIVKQLFSADMLSASGIRTLAKGDGRYRPGSYQNGSVWPWDNYWISLGLRRQGYHELADDLEDRLLNIVDTLRIYPEFVRGDEKLKPDMNTKTIKVWNNIYQRENVIEQPPQELQAFTVSAICAIEHARTIHSSLGLCFV